MAVTLPSRPHVGVIGLGHWGTALANHLANKGLDVLGWTIEDAVAESINSAHRNSHFLSHVALNPKLKATSALDAVMERDLVLIALPSAAMGEIFPKLKIPDSSLIVSAIKGLEGKTLLTPLQYLAHVGVKGAGSVVISGPSFAKDVIVGRPVGLVAASRSEELARYTADLISNDTVKVYISTDTLGVELGGIVKNVIALAVGVCDGLELGDSARAGLVTRGLAEMMRLAQAMGADVLTLSGLSGLGDLVMTATCDTSRNRTVGLELGRGKKLPDVLRELGSVAEGVESTPHVLELARRHKIEMPIASQVSKLLAGEASAGELVKGLITRPLRRELD